MIKIVVDSINGKIFGLPIKAENVLYKELSYLVDGYIYSDRYIMGYWDGYVHKYNKNKHSFPSGLLYRVGKFLKKHNFEFEIVDNRKKFEWTEEKVLNNLSDFKYSLRPYQIDGLIRGLNVPYMVFWWATSAGKTVQFSALISALKQEDYRWTLILVSTKDLAFQHRLEIGKMLDVKIGLIEEGRFEPERITVAVINTLWQKGIKQKNKEVLKYLGKIEHLISDESHRIIDSKMFKQTIMKCSNTIARHGFSGTPFSLSTDDLELESVTGPPLSRVSMSKLIKEGWVSVPKIFMVRYPSFEIGFVKNYMEAYSKGIVKNDIRNSIIGKVVYSEYENTDKTILIIIRIIDHGNRIKKILLDKGVLPEDIEFISGSTSPFKRNEVKEAFRRKELRIVIASSIWVEGIDIPTVDVLVEADGGGAGSLTDSKGIRSAIQKVGRVIRKPVLLGDQDVRCDVENIVHIYDFFDDNHKYLRNHSLNRFLTYKTEKEFHVKEVKYE